MCSLICALLVNHLQKYTHPSELFLELFAGSVQLFGVGEQVHAGLTSPPSVPRGRWTADGAASSACCGVSSSTCAPPSPGAPGDAGPHPPRGGTAPAGHLHPSALRTFCCCKDRRNAFIRTQNRSERLKHVDAHIVKKRFSSDAVASLHKKEGLKWPT